MRVNKYLSLDGKGICDLDYLVIFKELLIETLFSAHIKMPNAK